jgi:hypothetical protein
MFTPYLKGICLPNGKLNITNISFLDEIYKNHAKTIPLQGQRPAKRTLKVSERSEKSKTKNGSPLSQHFGQ